VNNLGSLLNQYEKGNTCTMNMGFNCNVLRSGDEAKFVLVVRYKKSKMHPCVGIEALYRPYGP